MGDNQLSILIQAKIDELSTQTMQKQLDTLAKNLKSVKISLDLGDVKAQFAKMFQEIEKESQKQKLSSGVKISNPSNQSFSGTHEQALKKAVLHVNALDSHFKSVRETVKGLGDLKYLSEGFASAEGDFMRMKAKVEQVDGTLRQLKNVEVFGVLNKETNKLEYEIGEVTIQTKEFGYTLKELQANGKATGLYESMQKYKDGVIDAKQYTEELQKAIYKYGNESKGTKKFFGEMDEGIQKVYLDELAKAQEKVNQQIREEMQLADEMNRKREEARLKNQQDFSNSKAIHDEKVKQWEEEQKSWEAYYKAKEQSQLKEQQSLKNNKLKENSDINKALLERLELQQKTLAMEEKIDQARKNSVSNISNAKSQYGGFIDESALRKIQLGFNELSVDTKEYTTDLKAVESQIKALEKAYAKVEQEAKIAMELDAKNKAKKYEQDQERQLREQIKLEEDIENRRINMIDFKIQQREAEAKVLSKLLQAQMQSAVQAEQAEQKQQAEIEKTNKELVERDTLYNKIQTQINGLGKLNLVTDEEIAEAERLTNEYRELMAVVQSGGMSLEQAGTRFRNLGSQVTNFRSTLQSTTQTTSKFFDSLKMMVGITSMFDVFNLGKRALTSMFSEVKTLDSALGELNKVANMSKEELNAFTNTAFRVSESVGRMGSDVIRATADFVQMGYSVQEASKLAENALMYVNVGDLGSVDDATSTMISTMKAFGIEAENSLEIVDKINNVSNNYAISAEGIGSGLQKASSALATANNDINETLALMAVGNQVVQDPDSLANGLKTISMRLRGLAEDGTQLESKMEDVFAKYANGVKILNDDGTFKSTFEILRDLGKEWDKLSDKTQAMLGEKIAGKNRANIFFALMQNAQDLDEALQTAQNSANSAMIENENFMNGIEGRLSQLKTAWQELSASVINSDFVKIILEAITSFVKFLAEGDRLQILLTSLTTAFTAFGAVKLHSLMTGLSIVPKIVGWFAKLGTTIVDVQAKTIGLKAGLAALGITPVGLAITALTAVVTGFAIASSKAKQKAEELAEANRRLAEEGQQAVDTIVGITDSYTDLYDPLTQTITDKEKLIEIQKQLSSAYGSEADGIDLLNGKYDENLAKLNEITEAKLKQNEIFLREAYDKAQEDAQSAINGGQLAFRVDYDKTKGELEKIIKEMQNEFGEVFKVKTVEGMDFLSLDTTDIKEAERVYTAFLEKLQQSDIDKTNQTYQDMLKTFQGVVTASENLTKAQDDLNNNLAQSAVKSAMAEAGCVDLKNATGEQVKAIQNFVKEMKQSNPVLADYTQRLLEASNQDFSNFTKANAEALNVYNTAIAETEQAMNSAMNDVEVLDSAIKTLTNDQILSGDVINDLISRYSSLQDSLTKTDKGYTLSKDALIALRNQKVDEANVTAQTQRSNVTNTITGVKIRLTAYKQEVSAIKTLAQAQQALAGAKVKSTQLDERAKEIVDKSVQNVMDGKGWLNTPLQNQLELQAIKQQKEENDKAIVEYESLVEGYRTLEELDKIIQKMDVTATNSFISATTPSSSSSSSGSGSSNSNRKSYIAEELDTLIDDILSSTEKLEYAIEFANEKLTTAQNKGDLETQNALKQQIVDLIKKRKEETVKQADKLRTEGEKMIKVLSGTGMFKGIDLKNLTEKQLSDVSKILEKKIASSTDEQAEGLEILKAKIEEYGQAIIRIYSDELPNLSKAWWEIHNEYMEKMEESINDTFNLAKKRIDESNRDIELQQILLEEGSQAYMELEKKKYENVLALQEEARQALKKIKEEDKNLEGELAQKYLEIWYDAEREKREMIKKFAEQAMKNRQEEIEAEKKKLNDSQDALNDLIEYTIKLLKQERDIKKETLQDEINAYKELIDKKKESLRADKEARDNAKELKEKQTNVSKIEAQIAELQFDTSAQATAKRLELEEQLAKAREELEDFHYEQSIEKQEEALDEEYERFKETKDKEIKAIEEYLKKEGNLRAEAIKLIESGNKDLYDKLIKWNEDYGSGVSDDITNAWDLAHNAMKNYNDGQLNVLETLSKITEKLKEFQEESENMKLENFYDKTEGGMMGDIQENPETPSVNHGDTITEEEAKKQEQLKQQRYLHTQAVKAKTEGNAGLLKWVQEERKKWGLDPTSGKVLKDGVVPADHWEKVKGNYNIYHTGGFVGGLQSNEEFAKLLKGEYVATEQQMKQFMNKTLPSLAGIKSPTQDLNFENLISLRVDGNLDSSVLPRLEDVIQKAVDGAIGKINNTMLNRGFKRTGMSIGI